jgi:hypothetical protein
MSEHKLSVSINRFLDLGLTFFNTIVALLLLTAPWYKITADETFQGCLITRGTVIAPFASGLCEFESFSDLPDGGDKWSVMHAYCIVYMTIALAISVLVGYETVMYGLRSWSNANTLSFVLNIVLLIVQSIILIEDGNLVKPTHLANETAETLILIALVTTCIRVPMLGWFMHQTYNGDKTGYFGTGSSVNY